MPITYYYHCWRDDKFSKGRFYNVLTSESPENKCPKHHKGVYKLRNCLSQIRNDVTNDLFLGKWDYVTVHENFTPEYYWMFKGEPPPIRPQNMYIFEDGKLLHNDGIDILEVNKQKTKCMIS